MQSYGEDVELITGGTVRLTTDETYKERCSTYTVYIDFMYLAEQLKRGDHILLDNETISLKVDVISATTLTCIIERGGYLGSYKDVFVPNVVLNMANYSEKDMSDIKMAIENQVSTLEMRLCKAKEKISFYYTSDSDHGRVTLIM